MARIVVLSDIHLSPTHGFFWENWCVARWFTDTTRADAVIVNGDLAINGPDSDAEIAFAATALRNLRGRVLALPGNHDVGDENVQPTTSLVPACIVPSARMRLLDKLNRSDVRLIVSGHLHQHRDRTFNGQRHLWVSAVAFAAPQAHGGDGRCGITVLDFSQDSVQVTVERPRGLVSHDLAAIKGHGRYEFLRDMPPSPPPRAG